MKVVVLFCENKSKKLEIEIDENNDVKNVKMMIEKLTETNEKYSEDYFHIFHRNIILDNDRMVKFYAIEPNDKIYIGKIENYLEIDDEIVELFVVGYNLSFEYVVIKRHDTIYQLKLLISRIIPECFTVWSFNGIVMQNDLIITDIIIMNRCCKLIIGCGKISRSFSYYLKIHDLYLVSRYTKKQKISFWTLDPYSESEILELKGKLIELKKSIENNEIIPKLNESLLNIPLPFIQSRYLFCMNTADEIWDICSDHWANMIGQQCIHRFIRNIFRVELNEELLIYSNLVNIIYSVLNYITRNKDMLIDNIRESMIKLLSKYKQTSVSKWIYKDWKYWHGNIDYIRSEYIDCVNEIAGEIMNEIKTIFITGNEDPLNYREITIECIDKYYQKICGFLIKMQRKRKLHKTKQFEVFKIHFNKIIVQSIGNILNFIQMYIGSREMKFERFEDIIKQHVALLLREYSNVIISRVYKKTNDFEWNKLNINEIINESIRRMFIRLLLNSYENAKSGLCNINANMSSDDNTSTADDTNEFLEKNKIYNELMDKLLQLMPGDGKFEKIMRNEIDRLISEQNFDWTHEDIVKESVKLFLDSEFSKDKFIEVSTREIFNSLNEMIFEFINKTNLFNLHIFEQNCDCDNLMKIFKKYVIPSLINNSIFQGIFKNLLNNESIKLKSWLEDNCNEHIIAEELIKRVVKPISKCVTTMKMESYNSMRSIVINALDKCIISLDDIFENPSYIMKFIRHFLLKNQSESYIDEILNDVSEENVTAIKIKHNNTEISLQIPVCQIKTIIQLKKSISTQTKIPIQQIYMIKYGEDEMPKDKEIIGSICDYLVTFVSRCCIRNNYMKPI